MQVKKQQLEPLRNNEPEQQFQIGKGIRQDYVFSPCLFNLYAKYIMRNFGLEETSWNQDCWEKYADDITLMAESEEELKSLLMKVKEDSEKADFNLSI